MNNYKIFGNKTVDIVIEMGLELKMGIFHCLQRR